MAIGFDGEYPAIHLTEDELELVEKRLDIFSRDLGKRVASVLSGLAGKFVRSDSTEVRNEGK